MQFKRAKRQTKASRLLHGPPEGRVQRLWGRLLHFPPPLPLPALSDQFSSPRRPPTSTSPRPASSRRACAGEPPPLRTSGKTSPTAHAPSKSAWERRGPSPPIDSAGTGDRVLNMARGSDEEVSPSYLFRIFCPHRVLRYSVLGTWHLGTEAIARSTART